MGGWEERDARVHAKSKGIDPSTHPLTLSLHIPTHRWWKTVTSSLRGGSWSQSSRRYVPFPPTYPPTHPPTHPPARPPTPISSAFKAPALPPPTHPPTHPPTPQPNYCGEFDNAGAMMSVDETLMCSFQILKPAEKKQRYAYAGLGAGGGGGGGVPGLGRPATPPKAPGLPGNGKK